jgi:hypothetical protein
MLAKLRRSLVAARITGVDAAQPDPRKYRDYELACAASPRNCESQVLWLWRQKDKDSKHLDYRVIEDIPILAGGTTGPRS